MAKKFSNSNKKGITITSLTIYVIVATIVVGILVFLNANFFSNINDLTDKANIVGESLDFKSAFIRDIKSENEVKVTDYNSNMIRLSNNVKYEIRVLDKNAAKKKYAIYRNDVQIAKNVVSHTEVGGQGVKEGPYFEYDVNTNTIKVGIKFSDGQNSYIESGTYVVGKVLNPSVNFVLDDVSEFISGDYNTGTDTENPDDTGDESEDTSSVPENERIYAVLYTDGVLNIGNTENIDTKKTILRNYGEISESVASADPDWLTQKASINTVNFYEPIMLSTMENLFAGCANLVEIQNINNLDTSNVTNAESAFKDCISLETINGGFAELDAQKITNMASMFEGCTSLKEIDLNGFDTSNVTNMASMFKDCSRIKKLQFDELAFDSVEDTSEMFSGCLSLTQINLNASDSYNLTNMESMFANCTSLISVDVSSLNTSNVTNINRLYYNCQKIQNVSLDQITAEGITDLSYLFYNCTNLLSVDFGTFDTSSVTDMSYMFANCINLNTINFADMDSGKVKTMEGMFSNCQSMISFDLSTFNTGKVVNMSKMFENCSSVNEFVSITSLNTENVTNMSSMFESCTSLMVLDLTGFDTTRTTNLSRMFMNSDSLKTISISDSWNTDYSDVDITDMFENCGTTVLTKK